MIVITSVADSGSGTLRQALLDAQNADTITFDPVVFPPTAPVAIFLDSQLPHIIQGNLTIDASNAGVILDGSNILEGEWIPGLMLISDGNLIQGLQVINFSGAGIAVERVNHNTIGGDRGVGSGPIGQGNLISGNSDGIGLFGASKNIVVGNLIGTDITGTQAFGNQVAGVYIQDGSGQNVIGPDNIIAYNDESGIDVRDADSAGNTITQNSIHDNANSDIVTIQGGEGAYIPPIILGHDLEAGIVAGLTCPSCIVEIFSTSGRAGDIYEGRATANDTGFFTFSKDSSFVGPHLTSTTTDASSMTSVFSLPTSDISNSLLLQEGNDLQIFRLQHKPSNQLEDNRIGSIYDGFWLLDMDTSIDNEILPLGLKRVRLAINGISLDVIDWSKDEFSIQSKNDEIISRIADNGITITYVLSFWDKATWPNGEGANCTRFKSEEEIQRYLDFVRFIVHHIKDRIQYFEIWNEPEHGWNGESFECTIQSIEVDDYINLVRRAIPVIREEYPDAKIVVGSTMSQVEEGSREYLLSILSSDIMPLVDVISWHPGYGISPEYEFWREIYENYPSLVQEIKDVAVAHGFQGEYTADEIVWWTEETAPPNEHYPYSEKKAAKYYSRFIILHLGMDVTVQPGGVSAYREVSFRTIQNLATLMAGAEPENLPVEIESQATDIMSYSFSLTNGDRLFALWTHGIASDDDPSINATLIFPGLSAGEVVGIDVLYGIEQEMMTETEDGNLVIRDLLVKDYPIILVLKGTSTP
jgi:hypothetical protein